MAYATTQDMLDRFGDTELIALTDRTDSGVVDNAVLSKAVADAEAEINAYIGGRYTVPLADPVPALITKLTTTIARYHLYEDRVTERVQAAYDSAIELLKLIGKGDASLGIDSPAPVEGDGDVAINAPERKFTADTLKDFAP